MKSSRERVAATRVEQPRDQPRAGDHREQRPSAPTLSAASADRQRQSGLPAGRRRAPASAPAPGPSTGLRRPASRPRCGRPGCAGRGCRSGRGSARPCWPPTAPCRTPARRSRSSRTQWATTAPSAVATTLCTSAPGNRDAAHGEQFLDVELQADAEHQQDDADLGQLLGEMLVGHEPWRVRTDQDSREQIPDDRRQAESLRSVASHERGSEAAGQRADEIDGVHVLMIASPRRAPVSLGGRCQILDRMDFRRL